MVIKTSVFWWRRLSTRAAFLSSFFIVCKYNSLLLRGYHDDDNPKMEISWPLFIPKTFPFPNYNLFCIVLLLAIYFKQDISNLTIERLERGLDKDKKMEI